MRKIGSKATLEKPRQVIRNLNTVEEKFKQEQLERERDKA